MLNLNKSALVIGVVMAGLSSPAIAGDADKGKKVFKKCKACHVVDSDKNRLGPSLQNVINRQPGTVAGFKYSNAMGAYGASNVWDAATLNAYLENPKQVVKGTRMAFNGLKKPADRDNVIAYLMQFSQ
jgi:cytochrome c